MNLGTLNGLPVVPVPVYVPVKEEAPKRPSSSRGGRDDSKEAPRATKRSRDMSPDDEDYTVNHRGGGGGGGSSSSRWRRLPRGQKKVCSNCGIDESPFWRKDRRNGQPLCNSCGLYLAKNGQPRPRSLWRSNEAVAAAADGGAGGEGEVAAVPTATEYEEKTEADGGLFGSHDEDRLTQLAKTASQVGFGALFNGPHDMETLAKAAESVEADAEYCHTNTNIHLADDRCPLGPASALERISPATAEPISACLPPSPTRTPEDGQAGLLDTKPPLAPLFGGLARPFITPISEIAPVLEAASARSGSLLMPAAPLTARDLHHFVPDPAKLAIIREAHPEIADTPRPLLGLVSTSPIHSVRSSPASLYRRGADSKREVLTRLLPPLACFRTQIDHRETVGEVDHLEAAAVHQKPPLAAAAAAEVSQPAPAAN